MGKIVQKIDLEKHDLLHFPFFLKVVGVSQCEWRVRSKALADFANDTFSNSAFSQPQREGVCVLGQNILPPVKFWKMLKQELPLHIEFQIKFKLKIIFYH